LTFAVAPVAGQVKVTVAAPVAVARPAEQPQGLDEVGVTVELPENPNLSLYLKKAKSQLAEDPPKYDLAIQLLQSVIDGRTDEAVTAGEEVSVDKPDGTKPDGAKAKADPPKADPAKGDGKGKGEMEVQKPPRLLPPGRPGTGVPAAPPPAPPLDPSQCVFSSDGRLYRPVRRLCHELLATMPTAGLQRYRAFHEYEAEQMLQKATLDGDLPGLEQVGNRYFITLAAGKAMLASADLLMHQGRYRAAVQVLRDLLEIYPAENRRLLAVEDVWLQFKIALAMRLAGELGAAHDAAVELAQKYPQATLRIMGELQAAKDLPASPLFAGGGGDVDTGSGRRASGPAWLAEVDALVPLWQFRYAEPQPYRSTPNREQQNGIMMGPDGGVTRNVAPPANKHGTGTSLAFLGEGEVRPNVLFLDHFCLRRGDPFTGLITNAGSGPAEMRAPRDGQPRSRVPSLDWGMLRPVEDDARYFTVTGYSGTSASEVLKSTDLIAWNKRDLSQAWSSREWLEGDNGLRDVTFLAAPTVFGERVLVPVKRKDGYYSLQCLDRQTGKPLWCTRLHAGGSQFYRAPGVPARVQGGIAYVLTNAGALAAIDAFSGNLKWIRRYERRDPLRPSKVASKAQSRDPRMMMMQQQMVFMEEDLPAYLPSDLVLAEGCVLFAPCDGEMLLCLDGASGEPVWMIDGSSKYQLHKQLQYLLGANSRYVFAVSEDALVCIGLRSGVRLWHAPLPNADKERWRGRGYVTEDFVLMPGNRELLVMPTAGGSWRRVALPGLGVGKEPLSGPCNLFLSGPWLGVCYAGGLEVYSAVPALLALAAASAEPLAKAGFLAQAGELQKGVQVLEGAFATLPAGNPDQPRNAAHMLDLVRDLSRQLGGEGKEAEARAWLDRVRPFATDRTVRLNWHLARMDLFQQCSDLRAYEDEQQSLYRFLEGKDQ
jgi:tetratricopeptide (TPR) repeat protein